MSNVFIIWPADRYVGGELSEVEFVCGRCEKGLGTRGICWVNIRNYNGQSVKAYHEHCIQEEIEHG